MKKIYFHRVLKTLPDIIPAVSYFYTLTSLSKQPFEKVLVHQYDVSKSFGTPTAKLKIAQNIFGTPFRTLP